MEVVLGVQQGVVVRGVVGVVVVAVCPSGLAEWPRMAARRHLAAGRVATVTARPRSSRMLKEQDGF